MEYSQKELIEGIKNEDSRAYDYMISKYTKILYYLSYNILSLSHSKEDIEECVSDVFVDAWIKIDEFSEEKGSFRTWLLMLTKYKALTYKRKKSMTNVINIDEYEIEDDYKLENQFILRQDQEKIIEVIKSFNEIDKEIFFRRYFFNEKVSDLAKIFKLSRSAIDNRFLRGRKTIKEALDYERRGAN